MKLRIAVLIALGALVTSQPSFARLVDSAKIIEFHPREKAESKRVNENFNELESAINDNFTLLQNHKNDTTVHVDAGTGGVGTGGTGGIGGDGSGGALTVKADDWVKGINLPTTFNFTTCHIGAGATPTASVTVTIPSGMTIRCKNGFTLNANTTLNVGTGFGVGVAQTVAPLPPALVQYSPGVGAKSVSKAIVKSSLGILRHGGAGFNGGGYLRILSDGVIKINGTINANGKTGYNGGLGGAGGGIVLLESKLSIDIAGSINANGGNASNLADGSGGGGGGIVVLVGPEILKSVNVSVNPGTATGNTGNCNGFCGGNDGGGASGGNGGDGIANGNNNTGIRVLATKGYVLEMPVQPATLVH